MVQKLTKKTYMTLYSLYGSKIHNLLNLTLLQ